MNVTFAQIEYSLKFVVQDSDNSYELKKVLAGRTFRDTIKLNDHLQSVLNDVRTEGYAAAGIDSVVRDSLNHTAYLYAGKKLQWYILSKGNVPEDFLDGTGFRRKIREKERFSIEKFTKLRKKIVENCENKGYPFASIGLDSVSLSDSVFSSSLNLKTGSLTRIDSVIIKGDAMIAPVYIYNYIGIRHGDLYDESQIRKISSRIKELPFVKEAKASQILFTDKDNKLYLFLENRKASQFDGVIGLQPDESEEGKFSLTGEVHLKLQNSLRRGEIIELNWKQLPVQTQDLKVRAFYPFLFNTPFGIDGRLAIFKKDTTYIDVIRNIGIQYAFTGNNYLRAFYNVKQSDLQTADGLENITVLPPYADISTKSYGVAVHFEKLDYRLNPRNGFSFETTVSTGNRTIRRNSEINPIAYDSLDLSTVTYQGEFRGDFYYPLGGRHVINAGNISGYIYNTQLFINELFRIGGLNSLRGFDEESIYASKYVIGKLEYRFLLEQNSFLFAFVNKAWYDNESRTSNISDQPIGMGAGINFETRLGIMSVSYALGKQFDNPVYFRNAKIHFGIVNYF